MGRVQVAGVNDIPDGEGREFVVADKVVAVFHVGDQYYALDGMCPHAGGPLGTGTLRGCIVTCPWHGWQFDVSNGKHQLSDNLSTTCYEVSVAEDAVWVEMPE